MNECDVIGFVNFKIYTNGNARIIPLTFIHNNQYQEPVQVMLRRI